MCFSNTVREDSGNCLMTLVKVNNFYYVNSFLDGEAVSDIMSLDLIKELGIKELLKDPGKDTIANSQRSQALDIAQGITIYFMEKTSRFLAIIYNHKAFYLWLKTKVYHKLKVLTV